MSDRENLLEATLNLMDEGIAILDASENVLFWNKAAAALTGYLLEDLVGQCRLKHLYDIDEEHRSIVAPAAGACERTTRAHFAIGSAEAWGGDGESSSELDVQTERADEADQLLLRPTLVSITHKLGHMVPGMLRRVALATPTGAPPGSAILFYPVEQTDALPHGDCGEDRGIERSQADMEDRLDAAHHCWATSGVPYGLLWITVDQAQSMRRTHGGDACEAMLRTLEQTLLHQMKPSETIGRWGCNEFLVLAHERTAELLLERGRRLGGLARTADFRWWGDRVGLTVSIGASQATEADSLQSLLRRAHQAMQASAYAGGNQITEARGT